MSTELKALLDAMQARCEGAMNAYYYSFEETGIAPIDRVLSMVARAGKGSHHTDMWQDDEYGPSHEQRIQEAANESADEVRRLIAAIKGVLERIEVIERDGYNLRLHDHTRATGTVLIDAAYSLRTALSAALIGGGDE